MDCIHLVLLNIDRTPLALPQLRAELLLRGGILLKETVSGDDLCSDTNTTPLRDWVSIEEKEDAREDVAATSGLAISEW